MSWGSDRQGGYVLIMMAALIVVLLGFAALAIDLGVMYGAHTAAQRAADAAALAGAYTFIATPNVADPRATAEARATLAAVQNSILGATIQSSEVVPYADVANRRVTVNLSHTIPTFFAGVLGQKFATVSVVAIAEADTRSSCSDCVKPWFIPNNIITNQANPCDACQNLPTKQLILEAGSEAPTSFAQTYISTQTGSFTIKPGNPANALNPGNFYAIVLPNDDKSDTGGDRYRENIAGCNQAASIKCGDSYYVKPGNMIGPTKQGVSLLISFGITERDNQIGPYKDTWVNGNPTYLGPTTPLPPALAGQKIASHQVVLAPIWDVCGTICSPAVCPGTDCGKLPNNGANVLIQVIGFARIFLSDIQSDDVLAYLVSVAGCGNNPAPCGGSSVQGYPLRLVRMN